jgi:hypothetical protein
MTDPIVIAAIALGLSVLVSAVRFVHWCLHADPKAVARTGRWVLAVLLAVSVPLLVVLMVARQWSLAMMLATFMLLVPALLGWRSVSQPLKAAERLLASGRNTEAFGDELPGRRFDDPELIRRSAAVLAAYLDHAEGHASRRAAELRAGRASGNGASNGLAADAMAQAEALAILGLERGASASEIREAHRRLLQKIHPDRGGSNYLAIKINQAKDALLGGGSGRSRASSRGASGKPGRRRARP